MRRLQTQGEGHCTGDRIHAFLEQIFDEAGEAQLIWVTLPCPYMRLSDVQRHLPPEATGSLFLFSAGMMLRNDQGIYAGHLYFVHGIVSGPANNQFGYIDQIH